MVWSGLVELVLAKPLFLKVKNEFHFYKTSNGQKSYCVSNEHSVDVVFIPSSMEKNISSGNVISHPHTHLD